MYSIALLMALTSGGEVSDGHRHGGCGGCGGYVSNCGGCGGYSECGGCGGRQHRCGHRHHGGCCGQSACGGCCGQSACGGCGGYSNCCGASACSSCCGAPACSSCGGQFYNSGCPNCGPAPMGVPAGAPAGGEQIKKLPAEKTSQIAAPAVIIVELPADATLKVDGAATSSTSGVRVLVSPELPTGKEYHYTLTAQVVRDGKPVEVEQRIAVRAGEENHVSLSLPVASVAQR